LKTESQEAVQRVGLASPVFERCCGLILAGGAGCGGGGSLAEAVSEGQTAADATMRVQSSTFETYIIATNYNGSGQDIILSSFTWGYNIFGSGSMTGTQVPFVPGNSISPIGQSIISNDYPNYNFYGL
jgi:hypothetical protein